MKSKYILMFAMIHIGMNLIAQKIEKHKEEHHKNDIGIANGVVHILGENEFAYGLGVHYVRNIEDSNFGVGISYERIFGDHDHNTIGLICLYSPIKELIINLSPCITFEHEEVKFGTHVEISYIFDFSVFHIGPVISFATDMEDAHLGIGMHIGYGF